MADRNTTPSIGGLHDRAGHLARRFQQVAVAHFTRRNGSFGVTSVQYAILMAIRQCPDLDQSALASLVAFDKSTLGVVVDKLEKRGMLKRTRDAVDKRRYSLKIAPKGSNLLDSMQKTTLKSETELLSPLSAAEQKKLKSLLGKLLDGNAGATRSSSESMAKADRAAARNARRSESEVRPSR
jgi:DNA-binding MarR family transcriptional regulator